MPGNRPSWKRPRSWARLPAKAIAFRKRIPGMRYRPDTHWEYLIAPGFDNAQDVPGGTLFEAHGLLLRSHRHLGGRADARTPGVGAAYLAAYYDAKTAPFDGARSAYRLRVPAGRARRAVLVGHAVRHADPA